MKVIKLSKPQTNAILLENIVTECLIAQFTFLSGKWLSVILPYLGQNYQTF